MMKLSFAHRELPPLPEGTVRRHYVFYGRVQGVGFRYRAQYAAQTLGLTGWVRNRYDGAVEMEVQGQPDQIRQLLPTIQRSDYIRITATEEADIPTDPRDRTFVVLG